MFLKLLILFTYFAYTILTLAEDICKKTINAYSPYYVTRTSANGSAVNWSRDFRLYHVTCHNDCFGFFC